MPNSPASTSIGCRDSRCLTRSSKRGINSSFKRGFNSSVKRSLKKDKEKYGAKLPRGDASIEQRLTKLNKNRLGCDVTSRHVFLFPEP